MTAISRDLDVVTVVNVFCVAPEKHEHSVDRLVEETEWTMNRTPGYVSVDVHGSLDGTRAANYAR